MKAIRLFLLGAIGGAVTMGIVGLFVGSVPLAPGEVLAALLGAAGGGYWGSSHPH